MFGGWKGREYDDVMGWSVGCRGSVVLGRISDGGFERVSVCVWGDGRWCPRMVTGEKDGELGESITRFGIVGM